MGRLGRKRPGFTLLELLVVVSIIALLVGLSLPSLSGAREQSKQLVCRQNLTSIWRGVLTYAPEYRDRVPFLEQIDAKVDPFDPAYPTAIGHVLGPYVSRGSFVCPSALAGFPDNDPNSRRKWKLTYDFSTADRTGRAVPYDVAADAYTGRRTDPAVNNDFHFDGRPLRMISGKRPLTAAATPDSSGGQSSGTGNKATVIWTVSVPLAADKLGESRPGDLEAGQPLYPHRGVVRRQSEVYRSLVTAPDPRSVSSRRAGYFHLNAEGERSTIFLTRYSPDSEPTP